MYVQGFWYGAGVVMAVFWDCLIASSNLQMCISLFIVLAKLAIAFLLELVTELSSSSASMSLLKISRKMGT